MLASAERLLYLGTAALHRHTAHSASGEDEVWMKKPCPMGQPHSVTWKKRENNQHPLSVTVGLTSVTLVLGLIGKHNWSQTYTHTWRTKNSWTEAHTLFQTMTTHDNLQPVDFRIQHDFRWLFSDSYFKFQYSSIAYFSLFIPIVKVKILGGCRVTVTSSQGSPPAHLHIKQMLWSLWSLLHYS